MHRRVTIFIYTSTFVSGGRCRPRGGAIQRDEYRGNGVRRPRLNARGRPLAWRAKEEIMDHAISIRRLYDLVNAGDIDGFGRQLADDFVERNEVPGIPRASV